MKDFKEFSQLSEAKGSIYDTKPKSVKDALDPEVLIQGFGRMKYTQLKKMIANGFDDMAKRAKNGQDYDWRSLVVLMRQGNEMLEAVQDIEKEMKSLENTLEEAKHDEKELRREAARTMMGKDIHMEILNIIKEQGISLREGADGVRVYYEIAKLAYMEGLTAGMRNNI